MLIGNIHQLKDYPFLQAGVQRCFAYARQYDLAGYAAGRHEIEGDRLYLKMEEYETGPVEQRLWEAHKKYLDVQILLQGREQIDLNFVERMQIGAYRDQEDILRIEGKPKVSVILEEGDFLICFPQDAHRSHIAAAKPEKVKKAIFKVRI